MRAIRSRAASRLGNPTKKGQRPGFLATCTFPLTNTGQAGAAPFDSDVYRVSATSSSADWKVTLPNALAAAKAGATVQVPVHVLRDPLTDDGDARTTVTLTAKSETDPSKTATQTCAVHVHDTTPATACGQGAGPRASPRPPLLSGDAPSPTCSPRSSRSRPAAAATNGGRRRRPARTRPAGSSSSSAAGCAVRRPTSRPS